MTHETWDQITRRHRAEKRAIVQAMSDERITQTVAARRLGMTLTGLNNFIHREGIMWRVVEQGKKQ